MFFGMPCPEMRSWLPYNRPFLLRSASYQCAGGWMLYPPMVVQANLKDMVTSLKLLLREGLGLRQEVLLCGPYCLDHPERTARPAKELTESTRCMTSLSGAIARRRTGPESWLGLRPKSRLVRTFHGVVVLFVVPGAQADAEAGILPRPSCARSVTVCEERSGQCRQTMNTAWDIIHDQFPPESTRKLKFGPELTAAPAGCACCIFLP
eukprot:scaffold1729_cov375-Prasinococcus_capsulatus_cf.AAC.1